MTKKGKILIIDDNEDVLFALNALLSSYLEKVAVSTQPENIERLMLSHNPDIILLDMNFKKDVVSGGEGFFWLKKILEVEPKAIVIFMTAYADTDKAVEAIKRGAFDFISKPWSREKLLATINAGIKLKESQKEFEELESKMILMNSEIPSDIIGSSEKMIELFSTIEKLSETDANVLLLGENGTGKDLIARAIHNQSLRARKAFIGIDLGSIPENLFESELFGYDKGAFTDAKKEKPGRIEVASEGTLFLDEIGNLSLAMQAKMLRTIESKKICRLGSTKEISINVRIISTTNADLYQMIEEGAFRQDLLYRINTIELHIPPLRERGDDVILLASYFLNRFSRKYKKNFTGISTDAKRKLKTYTWPGNVRELQNAVERAVILSSSRELVADDFILSKNKKQTIKNEETLNLEELEQRTIKKAIEQSYGNLNKASELLGISRFSLYRKINKQ